MGLFQKNVKQREKKARFSFKRVTLATHVKILDITDFDWPRQQ